MITPMLMSPRRRAGIGATEQDLLDIEKQIDDTIGAFGKTPGINPGVTLNSNPTAPGSELVPPAESGLPMPPTPRPDNLGGKATPYNLIKGGDWSGGLNAAASAPGFGAGVGLLAQGMRGEDMKLLNNNTPRPGGPIGVGNKPSEAAAQNLLMQILNGKRNRGMPGAMMPGIGRGFMGR